jgi:hypothetical protein
MESDDRLRGSVKNVPWNESRGKPEPNNSNSREIYIDNASTVGGLVNDCHPVKGPEGDRNRRSPGHIPARQYVKASQAKCWCNAKATETLAWII